MARAHRLAFKLPESADLRKLCALLEDGAVGSMTHLETLAPLPGMFMVSKSLPRFHRLRINIWMKGSIEAQPEMLSRRGAGERHVTPKPEEQDLNVDMQESR